MKTSTLKPQFYFPRQTNLNQPTAKPPHLLSIKTAPKYSSDSSPTPTPSRARARPVLRNLRCSKETSHRKTITTLDSTSNVYSRSQQKLDEVGSDGLSRFVILGAASLGFAMFLAAMDDQKALALGPEGPLMEDFWDNMRRYGLYALTVSTGALYAIFQPILELLKNPISALLIITILGGSFYIVSQVLSAMIGVTEFSYDYAY